ncbi:S-layer homology domain-containing protein [Thermophilibacter mediterraneus]|uniref:S-layer homology domain-containing protein n=1 Tax=Thermophilibacter mediterraneus TaxID=1871031 RepID=UPI002354857E|nr:S-layer homology domain-containing protein [Thermophilibacter mediterraneus]
MTACTNNGGSRARRAVTAALVGVLSVGAAPMVALATGAAGDVSLMFATDTEFSEGSARPTFNVDNDNDGIFGESGETLTGTQDVNGVWTVTTNQVPVVVSVDQLDVAGTSSNTPINDENIHDYRIRVFAADENGDPTGGALSGNRVVDAGSYVVVVTALSGSPYAGQTFRTNFNVVGLELPEIKAYEDENTLDDNFVFTGSELDVDFYDADNSKFLVEGVDYTVAWTLNGTAVDGPTTVGTYTATLTGLGLYAGSSATTTVKVNAFDLADSGVTIKVDPFTGEAPTHPSVVSYVDRAHGNTVTYLDTDLVNIAPVAGTTVNDPSTTAYTFDVTSGSEGNVISTSPATTSANKVHTLCTFQYNGAAVQDHYDLDASAGQAFNVEAITARYGQNPVAFTYAVTKSGAGLVGASAEADLAAGEYGEYTVTVDVAVAADGQGNVYAGSKTFTVKVWKGIVDADSSVYVYGPDTMLGETPVAIDSYEKDYDGSVLSAGSFTVTGPGIASGDIVSALYDSEGNLVRTAVDAGSYELRVTSDWYRLSGTTTLPITINEVDLTTAKVGALEKWNQIAGEEFLPVDNQAVNSTVDAIDNLELVYGDEKAVPDCVDVVVEYDDEGTWKEIGEVDRAGDYRVTISVADSIAENFILPEGENSVTLEFTASESGTFNDVVYGDWYFDAVETAAANQWINGIGQTGMFAPLDNMSREDVVCVLYRMAGGKIAMDDLTNSELGYISGFSDVDQHAYYAKAVAWATRVGIVNGYGDTFGVGRDVSTEEFCAMLARYARILGTDTSVDTEAELASVADGNEVSSYARDDVAWAVSEGYVASDGNLIDPQGGVYRARVVTIAVRYQDVNLQKPLV